MVRLVISGCCGKMGKRILAKACQDKGFKLAGLVEQSTHPQIGKELKAGLKVTDNPEIIKDADVLIEFTNPAATIEHLVAAVQHKKALVIGTTGLSPEQLQGINKASKHIPIVFSPNMSLGVNLVFRLVKQVACALGKAYKVDIEEAHHIHKKDAPSGTAKRLAALIKENSGPHQEVKINSIREDEIVGDHQVRFDSAQDTIIIKHSAKTRDIFAQGALVAAKFVVGQKPGLYDMGNVVESREATK